MERSGKAPVINLPVSLVLTDDGHFFFSKHQGGMERSAGGGICLDSFPAATLQRLILAGYISQVEVSRSDFTAKRSELMDVSKLIMYSTLYRHFVDSAWKYISVSDAVVRYNRSHSKTPFVREHLNGGGPIFSSRAEGRSEACHLLERIADAAVFDIRREDKSLSDEEKERLPGLAIRYLSNISAPFWLLLAGSPDTAGIPGLMNSLRDLLKVYLRKANIADYLALLLMEIGVYAEQNLVRRAATELFKGGIDADAIMRNDEARSRVLAEMERQGARVTIVWKIRGRGTSIGTEKRLEIILYNRDSDAESLRKRFEDHKGIDTERHALSDYYEKLVAAGGGEDLGMFYLGYIEEECRRQQIRFESHVSRLDKGDLTAVRLALHFR